MAGLKSLAKDTAIYGVSSIVGRFLNYLLVPIYTISMPASTGGYGVITNMYAITALLLVLLTCGMETGFFRFANKGDDDPIRVYSTTLLTVGSISLSFLAVCLLFLKPIAGVMGYEEHPWYLGMMLIVIAMDAIQAIPFAYLRYKNRPIKFAALKMLFIFASIALNIVYFVFMKGTDVGAAFLINLICTSLVMVCLISELRGFRYTLDRDLVKRMFRYSFPILILGIAGILNQVVDKIIFPFVYPDEAEAAVQLGIYGATSKIAMIMAMFTQAFRFAYEPFVFGKSREKDNRQMYAQAMKFFIIFTLLAFLAVMFYLDILRYVIGRDYWEGLKVVPIVMAAEMFMGVYFNLSFWYKLTDETKWGAYFSITACTIVVLMNVFLIPVYGYVACAWAGFTGYAVAMLLSYFVGQKKYPINYDLKSIGGYVLLALVIYAVGEWMPLENTILRLLFRTVLLAVFIAYIIKHDLPLKQIPVINRFLRR
ncbi:polysaccharide biosynthesis protein [Bacteroides salyersiae]|jgi:polysaccharide biosynthesis-related protein|uniref:polysaccharide biosynthesis C-terminal domain-containing protein n=1 Tax=Bacteroides salyersiae TaxID=291644 RepID=UPI00125E811A|nr:oligosaccharide flippase family protein [Bacteroides salyersiae]KAB5349013.1 polysaccharide biosynthesis protein [Bacteroides salyersiae]KAB5351007.1 polysaccharide biosynthesis protein [Bacteroides salyersiae]KAB5357260.1 polysaccharide biosynthesis protein [Bacteroides salyersiae]KAB5368410.1 polysaccharide biosynthesis protein [Bacteroides salyersiae]KAB5369610.1 polysaccharide biosynthesis protein [Bacteroides salyersiae]